MTQFLPIMGGLYVNFPHRMGAFFAIHRGGHSRRGPHIRSKFPSEYPPPGIVSFLCGNNERMIDDSIAIKMGFFKLLYQFYDTWK